MYERNYNLLRNKFKEFFLPTVFTSMAANICIFVDGLIVSFLIGAGNLSVIQSVFPAIAFVNFVYWMIGLGGSVLCSVAKAEFDDERSNSYFSISVISLLLFGILFAVVCLLFSGHIVPLLCTSQPALIPEVIPYFEASMIGMPFLCYMMCLSYFIRTDGFPKLSFRSILLANIVNLCCDVIYIHFFGLGVGGAALATTTGYIVGSIVISSYLLKSDRTLHFIKLKVDAIFGYLKQIMVSGFSSSSTQLYLTLKLFIINILLGWHLGKPGLIAFNICFNSLIILQIFLIGTSQTMSPIVSVFFREEDYSGVDYIIKKSLKIVLASSLTLSVLFIAFPQILLLLYSVKDPTNVGVVVNAIRIFALCYVGVAITFLYTFYTQAIQKNQFSRIVSLLEGFVVPISSAFILSYFIGGNGIWISFLIAEIVAIIFIFIHSRLINKRTDGEYSGFFINKHNDEEKVFDYTINADIKEAVNLASQVQDHLTGDKSAALAGLAVEEILVNIININENLDTIDVMVRDNDDNILISIKDSGISFNPIFKNDNLEFDNISVLNDIADKIDYSRVLGLNSTVIRIKK